MICGVGYMVGCVGLGGDNWINPITHGTRTENYRAKESPSLGIPIFIVLTVLLY